MLRAVRPVTTITVTANVDYRNSPSRAIAITRTDLLLRQFSPGHC